MKIDRNRKVVTGLALSSAGSVFFHPNALWAADEAVSSADTAWMLVCCALVMFMTPGLAFFYAGMVRSKNALSTTMYSFVALGVITIQWALFGYSLSFGEDALGGFVGGLNHIGLMGVGFEANGTIPHLLFMMFQGMFAIITPALISGTLVERTKFSVYVIFIVLWSTLVYDPICHWIWGGGWMSRLGVLDFAGGLVVHLSSGVSALVVCLYLGPRKGWPSTAMFPHNLPLTAIGAGMLWFGWFGFNAGSALSSGDSAVLALTTTHLAGGAGAFSWMMIEWKHRGKASMLGVVSGLVAGLACVTPAAGFIAPWGGIAIGLVISPICYWVILQKTRYNFDDSLDVFGIHGVSGIVGSLALGVLASSVWSGDGQLHGLIEGSAGQLMSQLLGVAVVGIYSVALTYGLLLALDKTIGLRVDEETEQKGLDVTQHGEEGYQI